MNPLWSLLDMFPFRGAEFYSAAQWLSRAYPDNVKHYFAPEHSLARVKGSDYAQQVERMFRGIAELCDALECPAAAGRTRFLIQAHLEGKAEHAVDECEEIGKTLFFELANKKFFYVHSSRSRYYDYPLEFIGDAQKQNEVLQRFPMVKPDLTEASVCYALERPTASAFHLMRSLEVAVFELAKALNVQVPTNRAWDPILDACRTTVDRKNQTRPQWVRDRQTEIEQTIASLQSYRNAWRNPTMHVEQVYVPEQAFGFLVMGSAFFRIVVKALP